MAISYNSLTRNTSGSFDNMVMCIRNGQTYYRKKPVKYHDARSEAQLVCRSALTLCNNPLKQLAKFARFSYRKRGQTQRNALMKRIMNEALTHLDSGWKLNPQKISLSSGPLSCVRGLNTTPGKDHRVMVSWEDTPCLYKINPDDRMFIIYYNPCCENNQVVEASLGTIHRSDFYYSYPTPPQWAGQAIYIYVYTISPDSRRISISQCKVITAS